MLPRYPLTCAPAGLAGMSFGSGRSSVFLPVCCGQRDSGHLRLFCYSHWLWTPHSVLVLEEPGEARTVGDWFWLSMIKADTRLWCSSFLPANPAGPGSLRLVNLLQPFLQSKSAGDQHLTLSAKVFCFQFYTIHSLEIKY